MAELLKLLIVFCLTFCQRSYAAPIQAHESGGAEHVVIINKDHPTPPRVAEVLERLALTENHPDVRRVFNNSAFIGFSANMKSHCLDLLAKMSDVSFVEEAAYVPRADVSTAGIYDSRSDAPWGLQRISTASKFSGNAESLDFTYSFANDRLGAGADIYIVDTGIYTDNNIFNGRARMLWSFDNDMRDNDGHGTHVAGTAGGDILGVASNANIFGIKALDSDGGGWSSNVVAGIDAVVRVHDFRKKMEHDFLGSVMSMSLATSGNVVAINSAIHAASRAGVHTVVAAGNDNQNACNSSPASSGGTHGPAITVGAVNIEAERAEFSSYGECVDVYAPGVKIMSSWIGGRNMIKALTGTSMATPHVTGIVAYAMANSTLAADPSLMKEWIRMTALPMSNGLLLANNGVQAVSDNEGFLGFNKIGDKEASTLTAVAEDTRTKKSKRYFSGLDSTMGCTRELHIDEGSVSVRGAWLCNAKRSIVERSLRGLRAVVDTVDGAIDKVHFMHRQGSTA